MDSQTSALPDRTNAPRQRRQSHAEADAQRAMEHTNSWTPTFERRQSWKREDQKHELHMTGLGEMKTAPGFSERT